MKQNSLNEKNTNGKENGISFETLAESIQSRKKDAVLNIRVNSRALKNLKAKARKLGIKYQTLIAELLQHVADNEEILC